MTAPGSAAEELRLSEERNRQLSETVGRLSSELAQKVSDLELANEELESFSYSVSHDLRAPLRAIDGFSQALMEDHSAALDPKALHYLERIRASALSMSALIDGLLSLSRVSRAELKIEDVDLSRLAEDVLARLRAREPARDVETAVQPGLVARGDARLLRSALENLLGNSWKFTSRTEGARIELAAEGHGEARVYSVRDNGAGFDMSYASKLFGAFQRLHAAGEFPGTGVGLAAVQRIVRRHRGRVWATAAPEKGATFAFTLWETAEVSKGSAGADGVFAHESEPMWHPPPAKRLT
jgi:light-regulated signal transduction histidine kinase (bacteriophytochrome)